MEHFFKRYLVIGLALLLIFGGSGVAPTTAQPADEAFARFIHVIPGVSPVDIYVDGMLTVSDLRFGDATPHIRIDPGQHQLRVVQAGGETELWEQAVDLPLGSAQTFIASTTNPLAFEQYEDDLSPLGAGSARFTAIHAIANGPVVDVVLEDGSPVIANLEYNQTYGTLDLPALLYDMAVLPTGAALEQAIEPLQTYPLNSGTVYTLLIYGTPTDPAVQLLTAPTAPAGDGGYLRVVHGAPGNNPVDVYVDDALIAPALSPMDNTTEYISLPAGTYVIGARPVNGERNVVERQIDLQSGMRLTVAILREANGDGVITPFTTTADTLGSDEPVLNVINSLSLADATVTVLDAANAPLIDAIPVGSGAFSALEPGLASVSFSVSVSGSTQQIPVDIGGAERGVYYESIVVLTERGPEVVDVAPASFLTAGVGVTLVESEAPLDVADAGAAEAEAPLPTAAPPTAVAQAAPTAAAPTAAAPTATPEPQGPVDDRPSARVVINQDANLQLRLYPTTDSFSLGLAPADSIFLVNGRNAGEPVVSAEATEPAEDEVFQFNFGEGTSTTASGGGSDPAPLAADTWLYVTYRTPDGGTINAWVSALYLEVRDINGNPQSLVELPVIPATVPGESIGTEIEPPSGDQAAGIVATIGGLDPGVNLNIRRIPTTDGESLALIGNDTAVMLDGISEDGAWAFIDYAPPEGGTVAGWISSRYIGALTYLGSSTTQAELEARGLLPTLSSDLRGELGTGTAPQLPTVDPLADAIIGQVTALNEGVRLQLRRQADADSESIELLDAGTELIVLGRNEDGDWLKVQYEGIEGWVSSEYVNVTLDGEPLALAEVEFFEPTLSAVDVRETENAPTAVPTQTPIPTRPMVVIRTVGMTREPGTNSEDMPVLGEGQEVEFVFNDSTLQYAFVELPDGTVGWVPVEAVRFLNPPTATPES